jgi:hypothetical protein
MTTLAEIEQRVRALGHRIGASEGDLPTFGHSEDGARPHIEVDARGFHYVVIERGQEQLRVTTRDEDELLWLVFKNVTFSLASYFELRNRAPRTDPRRMMFSRQIGLLAQLSATWAAREVDNHLNILSKHPFDDSSGERVELALALRRGGHISADEAWRLACEKFPLPRSSADPDSKG